MIKQQLKQALLSSGVLRLAGRLHGKGAAILMYHSVLEDPGSVANSLGGMIHPRAIFEGQMELLAREFHPVSLDQVGRFVRGEEDLAERAVVVTLDDGYPDNFDMAMPILDRLGVPAILFKSAFLSDDKLFTVYLDRGSGLSAFRLPAPALHFAALLQRSSPCVPHARRNPAGRSHRTRYGGRGRHRRRGNS